jgi:hypothetical protein
MNEGLRFCNHGGHSVDRFQADHWFRHSCSSLVD